MEYHKIVRLNILYYIPKGITVPESATPLTLLALSSIAVDRITNTLLKGKVCLETLVDTSLIYEQ